MVDGVHLGLPTVIWQLLKSWDQQRDLRSGPPATISSKQKGPESAWKRETAGGTAGKSAGRTGLLRRAEEQLDPVLTDPVRQDNDKRNNMQICRTPQLVGNFEALRFIEAEEKRKNKAEKGKRREKLGKRKTNSQPAFSGCKLWAFLP